MARARALSARHLTDKAWSSKPPYFSEQFVFLGQLLLLRLSKKQQPKKYKAALRYPTFRSLFVSARSIVPQFHDRRPSGRLMVTGAPTVGDRTCQIACCKPGLWLSLIHISEPTRRTP